ncbi:MAG: hypothetical protein WCO45_17570 [Pseudanabaena sp. ELA607]
MTETQSKGNQIPTIEQILSKTKNEEIKKLLTSVFPIDQFRGLLYYFADQKSTLHQTLMLLNVKSNFDPHLTIGGSLISLNSSDKIVWVTVELDSNKKDKKSDRMCPVAMHTEQWGSIWHFNKEAFEKPQYTSDDQQDKIQDPWKYVVTQREKMIPLSVLIDRCIYNSEQILSAEYFIVIFPECLNTKVDTIRKYGKLYQNGRAALILPQKAALSHNQEDEQHSQEVKSQYIYKLYHKSFENLDGYNEIDIDKLCKDYDEEYENCSFSNFVDWIRLRYNKDPDLEIKETVGIYVGYCFSDYTDAILWAAFSTQADENDIQSVETLLYKVHQEQTIRSIRDTIQKVAIEKLWSSEKDDWFKTDQDVEMSHSLISQSESNKNSSKQRVTKLFQDYLNEDKFDHKSHIEKWLEVGSNFERVYETLKRLCGYKSATQGSREHPLSLNSLFLVGLIAVSQISNSKQFYEIIFLMNYNRELLKSDKPISYKIRKEHAQEAIKSFFQLIQSLSIHDSSGDFLLLDVSLGENFLKFVFNLDFLKCKDSSHRSLSNTIYNSDSLKNEGGSVTEHYYKFKKFIESVELFGSSEDIVYKRSNSIINLCPYESQYDMTVLEIYAW